MTWKAKTLRLAGWLGFLWISSLAPLAAAEGTTGEARLLRFPDIHDDFVVFVYAGDVWRVPVAGGEARRLTSHAGQELFPKISPDGAWVAYSAENSGSRQVWLVPAAGGEPRQPDLLHRRRPDAAARGWDNWILGWTADGKILVRMNRTPWGERMGRYFTVDPAGGLETPLILPEGGSASLSPDGTKIAYTPVDREFRTWKRTRGGRAQDVWIYDFAANRSERLTDDPGTDNFPMWVGETIYFTSDREDTLNLFAYDLESKKQRKLTQFDTWDVLWPSLGPGAIVFMNGGYLYRFDLATEKSSKIDVRISTELPATVPASNRSATSSRAPTSPPPARARCSRRAASCSPSPPKTARRATSAAPRAWPSVFRRGRPMAAGSPISPTRPVSTSSTCARRTVPASPGS
ncbi:MAG: hypothetical protein HC897_18200 [Thermoanaerobaculia bacterium]|nr:hypothetical protein [Thermoanaerobaculia bacterium]